MTGFFLKDMQEQIEKYHESYRSSGIALMTTIIGLSSGVWYSFNGKPRFINASIWFLMALFTSIFQETVFYLASLIRARYSVAYLSSQSTSGKEQTQEAQKKADFLWKMSNRFFDLSDGLCFVSVLLFVIAVLKLW